MKFAARYVCAAVGAALLAAAGCSSGAVTSSSTASSSTASSSTASSSTASAAVYTYARHYVSGQVVSYTYSEQQAGNKKPLTAVAKLTSYVHGGVGGEQVRWVSLQDATGQNLDAQAQAFPAYDLSLDPRAASTLALPKGSLGQLEGPVDDLLTFFVDLSAKAGIASLHQPGGSRTDPDLLSGSFTTATAPVGQDVIQLKTTLTALTSTQVTYQSAYQPPSHSAVKPYRSWMSSPVCGKPDNFQLVEKEGGSYLALWGCESFTVTTVADRASGQIISVRMTNPLILDGKTCQDEALTKCASIPKEDQQRTVSLIRS